MRAAGISGLVHRKRDRTTIRVPASASPTISSSASSGRARRTSSGSLT